MIYEAIRFLHILGACVLIGTGAGIAFFMLMAHRSQNPDHIAQVARSVVIADFIFTATAVVAQPITGIALANLVGWSLTEGWIRLSLALYIFIGICWLPVVLIQMRLRTEAEHAVATKTSLSPQYQKLFKIWFALGVPAFAAILILLWLMISRPSF